MLTRRGFITRATAATTPFVTPAPTLRTIAAERGLLFGSEITCADLAAADYRRLIADECAIITPGLEAKWNAVQPNQGVFNFNALDHIADFASATRMQIHMHNLIWSLALPPWVPRALEEGHGADVMETHITRLAGRYRGRVESWDVINEPLDPRWPAGPEGLCNTPWRRWLGPDYVARALRAASIADPHARLLINEDDLEYELPDREKKRSEYLRLIEAWCRAGVPLHGFGLEAHLKPWVPFAEKPYRRFLKELAGFGLKIYITELDVCDRTLPANIAQRDLTVAAIAENFLAVALDEPAVSTVILWGLSDRTSYMNADPARRRPDGLPARPCPFDAALAPKPFYHALVRAFRAAPHRAS